MYPSFMRSIAGLGPWWWWRGTRHACVAGSPDLGFPEPFDAVFYGSGISLDQQCGPERVGAVLPAEATLAGRAALVVEERT